MEGVGESMLDDPYRDVDLVELYDDDNPDGPDHDFYRALADELHALSIVDLGCGTGLLTRTLAGRGRRVVGIDPSRTMLDHARAQAGAERIEWILGDATAMSPHADVDLVVCTGNAVMHLDDDALTTALRHIAAALRPGGVLAFETRNPVVEQWRSWTRADTYGERQTRFGLLREWIEVVDVMTGDDVVRVSFEAHNVIDGADRIYRTTLYFRRAAAIIAALSAAGFTAQVRGGWNDLPASDGTALLVVRAVRT